MYHVKTYSFCGMDLEHGAETDRADARRVAAAVIRRRRASGHVVSILSRGVMWEIGEPIGCAMVPDTVGTLGIYENYRHHCRECGTGHDDREEAGLCCAPCDDWEEDMSPDYMDSDIPGVPS